MPSVGGLDGKELLQYTDIHEFVYTQHRLLHIWQWISNYDKKSRSKSSPFVCEKLYIHPFSHTKSIWIYRYTWIRLTFISSSVHIHLQAQGYTLMLNMDWKACAHTNIHTPNAPKRKQMEAYRTRRSANEIAIFKSFSLTFFSPAKNHMIRISTNSNSNSTQFL